LEGINVYGKGFRNVYSKCGMGGSYVEMNDVYIKGRVTGYQIVPIDGWYGARVGGPKTLNK
jgi:hypothetical protein